MCTTCLSLTTCMQAGLQRYLRSCRVARIFPSPSARNNCARRKYVYYMMSSQRADTYRILEIDRSYRCRLIYTYIYIYIQGDLTSMLTCSFFSPIIMQLFKILQFRKFQIYLLMQIYLNYPLIRRVSCGDIDFCISNENLLPTIYQLSTVNVI